ncbi:MAG: hypothetical protein H0T84_04765 [Tatlockia sp.]|nr:hypothetical protein [Tatlockia sp.]
MIKGLLYETPEALKRQDHSLFLKCPLYRAKKAIRPIYINKELFKQYFTDMDRTWEQMAAIIGELFQVTLTPEGEQVGFAYVDRQSDPLNLSLAGNEGSGRAYYTGKNFNIKGEKTPLATSKELNHSNGVLAMQDGIWCSLIANSLYPSSKVSPVLTILDLNENYIHPITQNEVRRVKIIRLDLNGSLDRITHLFYLKKPLNPEEFLTMARQFGELDAHKFMQRIIHGSWSNGNISPKGHLIDYDSVCAVKGRQPQFSGSSYYIDNYFSFEFVGKLKVLESLINDPQINRANLKMAAITDELEAARNKEMAVQLLYLMGFTDASLFNNFSRQLCYLAQQLKELCPFVRYNKERSFFTNTPFHFFAHIFDFSNFFRYYPLLKISGQFDLNSALRLLVQSELIPEDENAEIVGDFIEEPLEPRVLVYLQDFFINSDEQIKLIKNQAYKFITEYNDLFDELIANQTSILEVQRQAYLMNEDRFYLFPVFDLSKIITNLALTKPAEQAHLLIEQIIAASQRLYKIKAKDSARSDVRLYIEGLTYIELKSQGEFQIVYELKKQSFETEFHDFTIAFNEKRYETSWKITATGSIKIQSTLIDIKELLVPYPRDEVFKLRKYELFSEGKAIKLRDYFNVDTDLQYYL